MPSPNVTNKRKVKIYADGMPILHATALDENMSRNVNKIDVIGDADPRVFLGNQELSGSLTFLEQDFTGLRFVRTKEIAAIEVQANADVAGVSTPVGTSAIQQTLTDAVTTFTQRVVALGNRLESVNLLCAKNNLYTVDLKVEVLTVGDVLVDSFVISNAHLPSDKRWMSYSIPLAERISLTIGTTYKVKLSNNSVQGAGGTLDFYGAGVKSNYTIGTGNGVLTNFALAHNTVIANTVFIRLDGFQKGLNEGYSLNTGTNPDSIDFTVAPANGVVITGNYEFEDADNLVAWRLVFSNAADASYDMTIEEYNDSDVLVGGIVYQNVKFSRNGTQVNPANPVEGTLEWSAESFKDMLEP